MTKKRIKWRRIIKDYCIYADNDKGEQLGKLMYEQVGRHFHFCWYQSIGIRMSPGCLQEVRDKQKELLNDKKKQKTFNDMNLKERMRFVDNANNLAQERYHRLHNPVE